MSLRVITAIKIKLVIKCKLAIKGYMTIQIQITQVLSKYFKNPNLIDEYISFKIKNNYVDMIYIYLKYFFRKTFNIFRDI